MIIDIPTSSDSEETKYPEDNTNYVWQTVRTKRTKKKAPDTKRVKKGIENFRNFKKKTLFPSQDFLNDQHPTQVNYLQRD